MPKDLRSLFVSLSSGIPSASLLATHSPRRELSSAKLPNGHEDGGDRGDDGPHGRDEVQEKGQNAPPGCQFHAKGDENQPGTEGRGQTDEAQCSQITADLTGDRVKDYSDRKSVV